MRLAPLLLGHAAPGNLGRAPLAALPRHALQPTLGARILSRLLPTVSTWADAVLAGIADIALMLGVSRTDAAEAARPAGSAGPGDAEPGALPTAAANDAVIDLTQHDMYSANDDEPDQVGYQPQALPGTSE